ncbi:hypothetical protein [Burkholderia glumae]|uniref:hypothetical protein n=1 Tax=Burkholderia glumae TaxID=337 RepID=UPI003B9A9363
MLQSLDWEKSRLSHQLTRMEARGLVARVSQDTARAINIALLPAGADAIAAARPAHAKAVRAVLRQIDEEDGHRLIALMERLEGRGSARRPV